MLFAMRRYNLESNFAGQCTAADSDEKCLRDADGQYRLSYNAPVSDADMMQTFLPAFESVVQDAKIRGIMCGACLRYFCSCVSVFRHLFMCMALRLRCPYKNSVQLGKWRATLVSQLSSVWCCDIQMNKPTLHSLTSPLR